MTDLETAMWEAWGKVRPKLEGDPDELRARLRGRRGLMYGRPLRVFCLAVRAGDLRITPMRAAMVPEDAMDVSSEWHPGRVLEHEVVLDARLLRELCAPVRIDPPGEPWADVARRLGCGFATIQAMRRNGSLQVHYIPARRGREPLVYTEEALDPGAIGMERPDAIWGHLWQINADSLPESVSQLARRWPEYREYRGQLRLFGWRWECPGCRRRVKTVFYPVRPPDWAEYVGFRCGDDEADEAAGPPPCFACMNCHGIIGFSRAWLKQSWNQLVLHYSGGLMYGSEVRPPEWLRPGRKREYVRRPREAKRRMELLRYLVGTELSLGQIAVEIGVKYLTVKTVACRIYRRHGVRGRKALRGVANVQMEGGQGMRQVG